MNVEKKLAEKNKQAAITVVVDEAREGDEEVEIVSRHGGRDAARNAKKRKAKQAIETAENRYAKRMSTYDEYDQKVLVQLERGNNIAQKEQDIKIMSMDLSGLDETSKAYFQQLKAEIAERLKQ